VIPINNLKLTKLKITLTFTKATNLPIFIGNTIRGALGQSLYKNHHHTYNILKVNTTESIPNPIVISAPYPSKGHYLPEETLTFYITLMGSACDYAQSVTDATQWMCKGKLANTQLINCHEVYNLEWKDDGAQHIPTCEKLIINFITPTEILINKQPPKELDFTTFIDRLFLRLSGIIDNYTKSMFTIPYKLVYNKPHIQAECDLQTVKLKTSSQPILGFIGQVRFYGDVTSYLPYIDLGSQIHIGKKTSRACGEYSFKI